MSDPDRDRRLAARPRNGWRRTGTLDDELSDFRRSPEFAAMRRFARIHAALREVLPPHAQGRVKAVSMRAGTLALEVADGVLLAELRATAAQRILAALVAAGTGASRLGWRVARRG